MSLPSFVHLRLHSEFSIVDGIVRIDDAVAAAVADGMPALALTDLGNLFGMVKFYQAARGKGLKPLVGADVWLTHESDREKPHRLLLLCQSHGGYLHLCDLLSRAFLENQHRGRAEVRREWFAEGGGDGLIALSGAHRGPVGQMLLQGQAAAAEAEAQRWAELFPGRYYLELQRTGQAEAEACVRRTLPLAARLRLPVVATHPVQFLKADEFKAHEARVCIAQGYVLGDKRRPREITDQQYFKTQAEMAALFADVPAALANSVEIAKRCNLSIELGKNRLPQFPTPPGMTLDDFLVRQAQEGLVRRMEQIFPDPAQRERRRAEYEARLAFENGTILKMGFSGYFLIVADFINWAKQNGVPVGPGRGSGAGSLVAFALGITDLDPIRYDLLFERFLNPERVSMPDFDVDFCQDGRERVIDYVKQKYGAASVSQIATFGTMAAKAVVRDVGRVLDLPYNFVDQLAKLVPFELGITLAKAREQEPQLNERAEKEEEVAELLELAGRLEGMTRNVGMHAGGVLIAPGKLTDFCPLYCADSGESVVSQFDKDDVEKVGLVKFDFLGLRTLTILDWAVRYVRRLQPPGERPFVLEEIPLDDPAAYALFCAGNTTSVFQSESRSAKDLERRLKPDNFEDIIALMALNRPGPLQSGMVDDFINRKHGRAKADYFHPKLEPVLKPTYGVIIYQEQVMQVAQILAGYTLGGADLLRRAMGKKKPEEMAQQREIFTGGAVERQVDARLATHLFDLMEKFAEYGFNKSHSAAYALVAYQTAFLKAHYPAAFMAATLSSDMDDTDKVHVFFEDAREQKLDILPPDANTSEYRFVPVDAKRVRYGLGAVKGTGESAIGEIVRVREAGGPFTDLFDFCGRVDKRIVNRRVVESLVRAGAFDAIDDHRARLMASVGIAMEAAEQAGRAAHQVSLFGEAAQDRPPLVELPRWGLREQLQNEKAALGFYLSGHPFSAYRADVEGFARTRIAKLQDQPETVLVAGVVHSLRTLMTRRGKMVILVLDDGTGRIETTAFNELWEANRNWLREDVLVLAEAKVSHDDYTGGLRASADRLYDLAAARTKFAKCVRIRLNGDATAGKLKSLLEPYRREPKPGSDAPSCPVSVMFRNGEAQCELELGDAWRVTVEDGLLESLSQQLRPENVQVVYP